MNAKILTLVLLSICVSGRSDWTDVRRAESDFACQRAYRKIDGQVFDLTPRFAYVQTDNKNADGSEMFASEPVPRFEFLHGKVLSVGADGILVKRYAESDFYLQGDYKLVYIKNYPHAVGADQRVALYAAETGVHVSTNATGARSTVRQYDFGEPPSAIEILAQQNIAAVQLPADMHGIQMRLVDYEDEKSLHRVKSEEPNLTLEAQRALNEALAREIQKRGGTTETVKINADKYFTWLNEHSLTNAPGNRSSYIQALRTPGRADVPKNLSIPLKP